MSTDAFPLPNTIDKYHEHIETHWSRNPISRRTALRGALLGAGAIALTNFSGLKKTFAAAGGTSGTSGAILVGRHLSFAADGQHRPTNSMRVTAQALFPNGVNAAGVTAFVRYTLLPHGRARSRLAGAPAAGGWSDPATPEVLPVFTRGSALSRRVRAMFDAAVIRSGDRVAAAGQRQRRALISAHSCRYAAAAGDVGANSPTAPRAELIRSMMLALGM